MIKFGIVMTLAFAAPQIFAVILTGAATENQRTRNDHDG